MFALLLQHPKAEQKLGSGIARITVEQNPRYPTQRQFWVHRMDGTSEHFSYRKCLTGEPSHQSQVLAALRAEVGSQIVAVRHRELSRGVRFCPYTREPLTDPGIEPHVHHAFSPFITIALRFVESHTGGFETIGLEEAAEGGRQLSDRQLASDWCRYHAVAARLRLVSRRANLKVLVEDPDAPALFCSLCGEATHEGPCCEAA